VTDPRPTQAEVEAKAAEMFGPDWKATAQREIAVWDAFVARHLDMAREAVMEQRA
jgi:hypothetical protein